MQAGRESEARMENNKVQASTPARTRSNAQKKSPLLDLLKSKNGRKMTKAEMQMAGSVVLICVLAVVLILAVKAFA